MLRRHPLWLMPLALYACGVAVLLAWIGVHKFGAGLGWVWFGFFLTTAPASVLIWWIARRRISDFEHGRRALPEPVPSFGD